MPGLRCFPIWDCQRSYPNYNPAPHPRKIAIFPYFPRFTAVYFIYIPKPRIAVPFHIPHFLPYPETLAIPAFPPPKDFASFIHVFIFALLPYLPYCLATLKALPPMPLRPHISRLPNFLLASRPQFPACSAGLDTGLARGPGIPPVGIRGDWMQSFPPIPAISKPSSSKFSIQLSYFSNNAFYLYRSNTSNSFIFGLY